MSLVTELRETPRPYDTACGADLTFGDLPSELVDFLHAVAACSPFLSGAMAAEKDWLIEAAHGDAEAVAQGILDGLCLQTPEALGRQLRQAKRRMALWVALMDCGGIWGLEQVTGALTGLADMSVDLALKSQVKPLLETGKLPGLGPEDLDRAAGLCALAMGKMGASELNYSSDIDLICLFADEDFAPQARQEAKPLYVKALRRAMAILSERTAEGYVFRTDLRLRPDPSVNPVAVPMSSAMRYYESLGRTWERAAFIKARPCAGDRRAGREFLRDIRPFVWRKLLDFATVAEIQDMRGKIRVEKGQLDNSAAEALDGVSVKLGRGGIRQIEFFTQTRQLIAGGRDPELRVKGTCDGLEMLCRKGWVTREDATRLTRHYRRLRQIENRVQMVADAQTHSLPANPESWARLAAFLGAADAASLRRELSEIMEEVHCLTEPLFSQDQHSKPARETNSPELAEKIQAWDRYPALRSERARGLLRRLIPVLAEGFSKAPRPEEALSRFEGFVAGLPAGVQLFSLFDANPHLIDLLVGIVSTSPGLAQYLSRNSQVLDAVVDGEFFAPWPGAQALLADLGLQLEHDVADYEQKLDATRRWHKDWHFRIGVHFLRGAISARQAGREYTELAEAVLRGLWPEVEAEFARRHGPPPGRGACVIGMGSLGGYQVGPSSDLDLIVIYDADPNDMSQGRKPLPASRYYARFTQALITALSTKTAEGGLYEVDMRLRPSGRQGPVATSWRAFQGYQKTEAWTWEHLALTRARPIAGAGSLAKDFDAFRQDIIAQPREPSQVMRDLQDMRQRLAEAKPRPDLWTPRRGFGGGQDIELFASALMLLSGQAHTNLAYQLRAESEFAAPQIRERLAEAHSRFTAVKQVGSLAAETPFDPHKLGEGGVRLLLTATDCADLDMLEVQLDLDLRVAAQLIDQALEPWLAQGEQAQES